MLNYTLIRRSLKQLTKACRTECGSSVSHSIDIIQVFLFFKVSICLNILNNGELTIASSLYFSSSPVIRVTEKLMPSFRFLLPGIEKLNSCKNGYSKCLLTQLLQHFLNVKLFIQCLMLDIVLSQDIARTKHCNPSHLPGSNTVNTQEMLSFFQHFTYLGSFVQ